MSCHTEGATLQVLTLFLTGAPVWGGSFPVHRSLSCFCSEKAKRGSSVSLYSLAGDAGSSLPLRLLLCRCEVGGTPDLFARCVDSSRSRFRCSAVLLGMAASARIMSTRILPHLFIISGSAEGPVGVPAPERGWSGDGACRASVFCPPSSPSLWREWGAVQVCRRRDLEDTGSTTGLRKTVA